MSSSRLHSVTLIPGDGIGPEVAEAARRAVDATGVRIDWEPVELNADIILKTGQSLPQNVIDSLQRTGVGLKGPVTTPVARAAVFLREKTGTRWSVRSISIATRCRIRLLPRKVTWAN